MLAFTPAVKEALHWFALTHQIVHSDHGAYWLRTALPAAGGVGDQDALLFQSLEYLRELANRVLDEAEMRRRRERRRELARERRAHDRVAE